jgi:thiol-disulfide isomerase/thioredoxin
MPAMKLFHRGQAYDYQAPADTASIVDVARWNAGAHAWGTTTSKLVEVEGPLALRQLLTGTSPLLVLVSFTTRWCTRCLANLPSLVEASRLLGSAAITVAVVNMDDPRNQPLIEQHDILAFPQQKVLWLGHVALHDFPIRSGAGAARDIAEELIALRRHLMKMDARR